MLTAGCGGDATSSEQSTSPLSPSYLAANGYASPNLPRITCEELKQKVDKGDAIVIVDVRPRVGFELFSIPGAINIPNEPEADSAAMLRALPKDKLIVFYCT